MTPCMRQGNNVANNLVVTFFVSFISQSFLLVVPGPADRAKKQNSARVIGMWHGKKTLA